MGVKLSGPLAHPWVVVAAGAVPALVGGTLLLGGTTPRFALPITLGLAVLLFAIAVDVAADIVVVVGVVALGASLLPRSAELERVVQPEPDDRVMVVLGDSYTSGEGATEYYEGTNVRDENECRRSPHAYGPLAVATSVRIDSAVFVACSGALAEHIVKRAQHPDEPDDRPPAYGRRGLPQLELPAQLPLVRGDYVQLEQVLTNLLENAARHAPQGTIVRVGAREAVDHVEVWVDDEGTGVAPFERDRIFEPFRSGEGSPSSGIGLAICKAIVEAHDGTIRVDGSPASGARFTFTVAKA